MKKWICLLSALCLLLALGACAPKPETPPAETENTTAETAEPAEPEVAEGEVIEEAEPTETAETAETAEEPTEEPAEEPAGTDGLDVYWSRQGYYTDESGAVLNIMWMEDVSWLEGVDEPGWYVSCLLGEDWIEDGWGGILPLEGETLRGTLPTNGSKEPISVTVTPEGEDGLVFTVEGGETYHVKKVPEATIFVSVNTEGRGNIEYAEGTEAPEIDTEYPYQSAQINLAEPATYTLVAWPSAGSLFVKWTKDGEDLSTEPVITLELAETMDLVAVFEEDPDWQNPVMNFIGTYQCERAHATVEAFGYDEAWITIDWGDSAWSLARWTIVGQLDTETMTIAYEYASKVYLTYNSEGEVESEETEYTDGTGTVTFNEDGSFTWHEDQSVYGTDMVFEWVPAAEE